MACVASVCRALCCYGGRAPPETNMDDCAGRVLARRGGDAASSPFTPRDTAVGCVDVPLSACTLWLLVRELAYVEQGLVDIVVATLDAQLGGTYRYLSIAAEQSSLFTPRGNMGTSNRGEGCMSVTDAGRRVTKTSPEERAEWAIMASRAQGQEERMCWEVSTPARQLRARWSSSHVTPGHHSLHASCHDGPGGWSDMALRSE